MLVPLKLDPVGCTWGRAKIAEVCLTGRGGVGEVRGARRVRCSPLDLLTTALSSPARRPRQVFLGNLRGSRVAVKRSTLPESQAAAALEAFQAEANAMLGCTHPNLLPLIGVCMEAGRPMCIVSPYMAGGNLYGRLFPELRAAAGLTDAIIAAAPPPPPLTAEERVDVLVLMARALTYLHGLPDPIVHRDVKSLNILLDGELGARPRSPVAHRCLTQFPSALPHFALPRGAFYSEPITAVRAGFAIIFVLFCVAMSLSFN